MEQISLQYDWMRLYTRRKLGRMDYQTRSIVRSSFQESRKGKGVRMHESAAA